MSILVEKRTKLAEEQIAILEKRRAFISQGLRQLVQAAQTIQKKGSGLKVQQEDVLHLISDFNVNTIEKRCIEFWLNKMGYATLPIREAAMTSAFERPPILKDLIRKAHAIAGVSTQPELYFTDMEIIDIPVTDNEKNRIHKRCEVRVETESERSAINTAMDIAELINRSEEVDPAFLIHECSWLKPFVTITKKGFMENNKSELKVNLAAFKTVHDDYLALDEGNLSKL